MLKLKDVSQVSFPPSGNLVNDPAVTEILGQCRAAWCEAAAPDNEVRVHHVSSSSLFPSQLWQLR